MIVATETTSAERTGLVVELSLRDRIRAGDPEAFAELFAAHARAVYGHAARLSADRGTAEDVVSLTFLEAWRLREKLRPEAATLDEDADLPDGDGLRPWLYGIATNVLRNTRRAARRHSAALARLPNRPADRDTLPDFADDLVGRMEKAERLAAAQGSVYGPCRRRSWPGARPPGGRPSTRWSQVPPRHRVFHPSRKGRDSARAPDRYRVAVPKRPARHRRSTDEPRRARGTGQAAAEPG
ncbi:RNA polymerase sigma factor [Streptomyces sp. NPDC001401]|uniref:RNA polymerase sigma factor n=1 Tax=Streptomyces sp. NPDC001401 TaxID=3364570 RepID=UPI00368BBD45